jgi:poly-gamma-glutamate capsule biosynthesis protein CapA/YwtB (metallophosphatase superfamily)
MYFATFDADDGNFVELEMVVLQIKRFRLNIASVEDTDWLRTTVERESARFGVKLQRLSGNRIKLKTAA